MKKIKALVLLSGGLVSILAIKLLMEEGIETEGLSFKSCFFDTKKAEIAAEYFGIKLRKINFSTRHLKMVKNPRYGYGKNMNPCIDCHLLMLKIANEIREKERFDFVATGEVLGQRPMSQNKRALELIEKESGLSGKLLRPLSARLLRVTEAEKKGLVDRNKLLDISGRQREKQLALAKKYKIKWYPSPSGGCLLTDPMFGKRLKELFDKEPKVKKNDIELLKIGRHFWEGSIKIIVGRNHQENLRIKKTKREGDFLVELKDFQGPSVLIRSYRGEIPRKTIKRAQKLAKFYSREARDQKAVEYFVY